MVNTLFLKYKGIKKAWRLYPLLAPRFEALGIALLVRTSNQRPHADMNMPNTYHCWCHTIHLGMASRNNKDILIVIPMGIYRCCVPWQELRSFLGFRNVREQARDKRLLYVLDQHLPPITRFIQLCHVNDVAVLGTAWVALSDITREHVWHRWLYYKAM